MTYGKDNPNEFLINNLAEVDTTTQTFDHKVGDTADTLKLSLTINASGIAADKSKLDQYAVDP